MPGAIIEKGLVCCGWKSFNRHDMIFVCYIYCLNMLKQYSWRTLHTFECKLSYLESMSLAKEKILLISSE